MDIQILQWGNGLGVRLTKTLTTKIGLKAGDTVQAVVESGAIKLIPSDPVPEYTLSDLLSKCPKRPSKLDGDALLWQQAAPVGREVW